MTNLKYLLRLHLLPLAVIALTVWFVRGFDAIEFAIPLLLLLGVPAALFSQQWAASSDRRSVGSDRKLICNGD